MTAPTTNALGVHALVWAGNTSDQEVRHAVDQTARAGYDILELSLHDLDSMDLGVARTALDSAGIQPVCSRGLAFDADVSSDDAAVVARGAELLQKSLAATHELGGSFFTGALYSALGKYPGPLTRAGRANAVSVIRELAEQASLWDMRLGLEVCNRYETNVLNTARDALRMADDIGADNVYIHLDTYHMNIEEDDVVRPVVEVGDRLGYVHVGENHRGYLGSGHFDFGAFFHALADVGYLGPVTFESFSSAVVARGLSNDLAVWRDLWEDGFELACKARQFLAAHIDASRSHA
ncbi:sugar phosphate isomerase/epimerase [uncultured Demequina sp.]|uniref:sugar phosphate isomerase/epimerase family protein n=1 Tax=uncultured Demequina sp. TaxID=693499 RepID=UPI0025FBC799|nr:sugar phosphate isomerase/epimerase [uncultured Demequina sp.]